METRADQPTVSQLTWVQSLQLLIQGNLLDWRLIKFLQIGDLLAAQKNTFASKNSKNNSDRSIFLLFSPISTHSLQISWKDKKDK